MKAKRTCIFILFISLICSSCMTAKINVILKEHGGEGITVASDEKGVRFVFEKGDILFDKDSSYLTPDSEKRLENLVNVIKIFDGQKILIKGYTAFSGTKEGRRLVSEWRALEVANYFTDLGIVNSEDVFIKTYGASNPVGSNKTEEGRAKNRRIEVVLLNKNYKTEVQSMVEQEKIRNVNAVAGTDGTMIRAGKNNIHFDSNSSCLSDCDMIKLDKIAEVLSLFEDNYVLIKGHAALSDTDGGQLAISAKRANNVANYLMNLGIKNKSQFIVRPCGASEPIASNETKAGRAKNRRVEIIVLDSDYNEFEEDFSLDDEEDDDDFDEDDEYNDDEGVVNNNGKDNVDNEKNSHNDGDAY